VLLDADRRDQTRRRGVVREDSDDPRAALDLGVDPLQGVVRLDLRPVALGEAGEGAEFLLGVFEHVGDDVEATLELSCESHRVS